MEIIEEKNYKDHDVLLCDILNTCSYVKENSLHVKINELAIDEFIYNIPFEEKGHWLSTNPFGLLDLDVEDIIHFLVILESINCSFWGSPKWTVKAECGDIDGSFALIYCLLQLRKRMGHLDFEKISFDEFSLALQGNVEIPLLQERYKVVKEVSRIINSKMNGNFYNFIKDIKTDNMLFKIIIESFPSFRDQGNYNHKKIYFYKLAQLLVSDILHVRELKEKIVVDYSNLVGCADYKIPQVLRAFNILIYDDELSELVDNKIEIMKDSVYEIEIRANMLVAINMIKEKLGNGTCSIAVNDLAWSLGHSKDIPLKPYHLTRTMSY